MDRIVYPKLICVEGKDEVNFFNAFLKYHEIEDVQIFDFEGKSKYKSKIPALINMPGFDSVEFLVLIRDSDDSQPTSAFASLAYILQESGLTPPRKNQEFSNGLPKIGIFIMPGEDRSGALEDLCLNSISSMEIFQCIEQYFSCINSELRHTSKAKVLCYLAGKDPYTNSLGLGALKGHWDFLNDSFNDLTAFIEQLR